MLVPQFRACSSPSILAMEWKLLGVSFCQSTSHWRPRQRSQHCGWCEGVYHWSEAFKSFLCIMIQPVPVPEVYLYCSTPDNPVQAEWIIIQYMPGTPMADCLENLTDAQNLRTMTEIMTYFKLWHHAVKVSYSFNVQQSCQDDSCQDDSALEYICQKFFLNAKHHSYR